MVTLADSGRHDYRCGSARTGAIDGSEGAKIATVVVAVCAALGGPTAFTIANVTTPKDTAMPTSGPASAASNPLPSFYRRLDPQLVALIKQSAARWPVATTTSSNAASIQLDTATPVMAIGGFSGHSNAITLQQFIDYAHNGTVRFYAEPIEDGAKQQEERQPGSRHPRSSPITSSNGSKQTTHQPTTEH